MLCVKSVFSSTVATGMPLRNSTRSMHVLVVQRIAHLAHHAQAVGGVAGLHVGFMASAGLNCGQLQRLI
jgi:hypothetical protein